MTHLTSELSYLKSTLIEMWNLVIDQIVESSEVLLKNDKDLASDVLANEKRVDAFELKIDMDCEKLLALQTPVANDLRFIISVLKITYNLERIGDYAKSIVKFVNESEGKFKKREIKESKLQGMFETAVNMLTEALNAFEKEDVKAAKDIFKRDIKLDKVNRNANTIIAGLISKKPEAVINYLNLLSIIHKLERVGDQTKNISEEIIFYIEAQVLKHRKKELGLKK